MSFLEQPLPSELQTLTQPQLKALESFVRSCLLAIGRSPGLARRLNVSSTLLQDAFVEYFNTNRARPPINEGQIQTPPLQLVFRHDCMNLGCLDTDCNLCKENPHRRCDGNFSNKYLAGDVLKAKCGAAIRIELLNRATAESVPMIDGMEDIRLEMAILDGKEYASLQDGRNQMESEVQRCVLLSNNQQKELLIPSRGGVSLPSKFVALTIQRGQAYLPELVVTGSSEALLSGQKPPFRLFVCARNVHDGSPVDVINFVVSEPFVVATPRVRTAAKANIPHVDDHVKVLAGLGNQTQQKLLNIPEAAAAVGVTNLQIPHSSVSKVGQFRDLIREADRDRMLCDTLKKVLKLTKGWDAAREHALSAVNTDNRMRIWYKDDSMLTGLLFRCNLGNVDLENPVGLLTNKGVVGDHATLEATLVSQLQAPEREQLRKLQSEAASAWWQQGHPGWAIWPVDSDAFQKAANSQVEALVREAKEVSGVEGFEGGMMGLSSGVRVPAGTTFGGIATSVPKGKKPRSVGAAGVPPGTAVAQSPVAPPPAAMAPPTVQQQMPPQQQLPPGLMQPELPGVPPPVPVPPQAAPPPALGIKRPAEGELPGEAPLPKLMKGPEEDSEGTVDEDR